MIVSDDHVASLYLNRVRDSFLRGGFAVADFVFSAGEGSKCLSTVEQLLVAADAAGLTRTDGFAALGGGVVGDLTGLAAALYLRGTDFVQLPTTLLAMVDASVGGKTAVNLTCGKNLCGVFHQPRLVLCDPDTLSSLSPAIYAEGMAEVIKHGALGGPEMLDRIRTGGDLERLIADNIQIKSDIVSEDEREGDLRQLLNLGHTFGHAIEKLNGFRIYHGEGVSVGMMIAATAAVKHGLCESGVAAELRQLLSSCCLPVTTPFSAAEVALAAMNDKKRRGEMLTVVLPTTRGRCILHSMPAVELPAWIACCDGETTAVQTEE